MIRSVLSAFAATTLFTVLLGLQSALSQDNPNVKMSPNGDPAMIKAHEKSEKGLDDFLEKLSNPPEGTENYAVKLGFEDKGTGIALTTDQAGAQVEYMWVYQIKPSGDHYTALLGDTPQYIQNIKPDEKVEFKKSDIFDWTYVDHGKMKGNYTACPLLLAGPKEELQQYRDEFGLECE
ncbi:YegJ family protein [Oryzifoliimicrobium ureilyticus]|uniref:YegJ family protein n=1 Tax=Oryzifoliimicrobium ureilyticus TaxID=3113724 RepID=UPI0030760551